MDLNDKTDFTRFEAMATVETFLHSIGVMSKPDTPQEVHIDAPSPHMDKLHTHKCNECGTWWNTKDDAYECCAD